MINIKRIITELIKIQTINQQRSVQHNKGDFI